jgi:heme/copper-type cytochrome/quinol oxidase subunit 4
MGEWLLRYYQSLIPLWGSSRIVTYVSGVAAVDVNPVVSVNLGLVTIMVLLVVWTSTKTIKTARRYIHNILVAALIIDACIGVPLWIMFQSNSATILSMLAYNIGIILR